MNQNENRSWPQKITHGCGFGKLFFCGRGHINKSVTTGIIYERKLTVN